MGDDTHELVNVRITEKGETLGVAPDEAPLAGYVFVYEGGQCFLGKLHWQRIAVRDASGRELLDGDLSPVTKPLHPYLEPVYQHVLTDRYGLGPRNERVLTGVDRRLQPILGFPEIRRKDLAPGIATIDIEQLTMANRRMLQDLVEDYEVKLRASAAGLVGG
jgi:hypothetical protein